MTMNSLTARIGDQRPDATSTIAERGPCASCVD